MKHFVIAFFILFTLVAKAQFNNGRRQRVVNRNPVTQQQKTPEFNVKQAIGLSIYDVDLVIKKLKLKESWDNYNKIVTVFNAFNRQQRELSRIHSFEFSEAKSKVETAQKEVLKSRDYSVLQKVYKEVSDGFVPITDQIKEREKKLDEDLEPLFSKKQFKKWKKLQMKIKKKTKP
tara:strand:+ start:571 stop:1095 length:525 start_codon:yes stop_codon:yes gene_type:complete